MFGYMGKILSVDLSKSKISEEIPSEEAHKMFLGGERAGNQIPFR